MIKHCTERVIISLLLKENSITVLKNEIRALFSQFSVSANDFTIKEYQEIFNTYLELKSNKENDSYSAIIYAIPNSLTRVICWQLLTENDFMLFDEMLAEFVELKKLSKQRRLNVITEAAKKRLSENDDSAIRSLVSNLKEIEEINRGIIDSHNLGKIVFREINKQDVARIKTGFYSYDRILNGGYTKTSLNVLAARPGVGKTSLAICIINNILRRREKVIFFSLEQSVDEIGIKIINGMKNESNKPTMTEFIDGISKLADMDFYINEKPKITTLDIELAISKISNLSLCVVDYLGLITPIKRRDNKATEIGEITRDLKIIARGAKVPILLLCQLNREVTKENRLPRLSDLRDSGSIEQDADTVTMISRDLKDKVEDASISVEKNRHGECGTFVSLFYPKTQVFIEEIEETKDWTGK